MSAATPPSWAGDERYWNKRLVAAPPGGSDGNGRRPKRPRTGPTIH